MNVTASPPDSDQATEKPEEPAPDPSAPSDEARRLAELFGGEAVAAHSIAKVVVEPERWVEVLTAAKSDGFSYFSFLSAIDWTSDVAVGDAPSGEVKKRIELLCMVAETSSGAFVTFSTTLDHTAPAVDSLVSVFPGANWHEREAAEMFGITFRGHPSPGPLYLPDGFHGHPLRKSFPLLSREVKPWPGTVDVEGMPGEPETDESGETGEPAEAAESEPAEVAEPAEAAEPDDSAETDEPTEPAAPAETAEPAEAAEPDDSAETDEPTEPAEPADSAKTDELAESAEPDEPEEAETSGVAEEPAEEGARADSDQPGDDQPGDQEPGGVK